MNLSAILMNARPMKRVIARAIACGIMLLFLPSCGIPPLRHAEPGPGLPEDFNGASSPENSAHLGIDEFYNDRMLTCLIEKALFDNRELKALNEEVQISGNEVLSRSGAYLPFISVASGASLNRYSRFTEEGAGMTSISPTDTSPIRRETTSAASTSPGSWTSTGSCGTPGTRRRSATSPPARDGITS
jgi:outer membrane protein TolC